MCGTDHVVGSAVDGCVCVRVEGGVCECVYERERVWESVCGTDHVVGASVALGVLVAPERQRLDALDVPAFQR